MDGCLRGIKPLEQEESEELQGRMCNSDDTEGSNCRSSPFHYPEIRVHNQAWEAGIFFSWIVQISLMELLDVPVTVGMMSSDTKESSFYNVENNLPFSSKSYAWDGIRKANELGGNCLLTDEECVNLIADCWVSQTEVMTKEYADGQLDYLDGNGQVGKLSIYVPKFTARRYPFAVTHLGLSQNRHRLAEVFKRPTNWGDYCNEVSANNCTVPDGVADRYPGKDEAGKYFADGYIGHFRATAENNCTGVENNNTCTGHIGNGPCTWSSYVEAQTYWLDIALQSSGPNPLNNGYSYSELIQIWDAANATKSDIIQLWYEPDARVEIFRNTDAEFTKVYLPTPSLQCEAARASFEDRCSEDPVVRRGTKEGACDNSAHITKKAIAISLRDSTLALPPAEQSPAYAFIQNFNIDQLQINEMLSHFGAGGRTGYAAREAVCTWIASNTDYLKSLIPPNHPKVFQHRDENKETMTMVGYGVGGFTLAYIILSTFITFQKRKAPAYIYAQVQFIFVVLFGLCLVAIGGILYLLEPDDIFCLSRVWLVSMGYTFMLVPLIIKVTALNHLMKASQQMRRINVNPNQLYSSVVMLSFLLAAYLVIWTVLDPPKSTEIRKLEQDLTTVTSHFGCRSVSSFWQTGYNLWEGLLVLWASVLAFQSRNVQAEFNESKSLGMMSYSHFIFLLLRVIVSVVFEDDAYISSISTSYLLSIDIIVAITIYLVPKMVSDVSEIGSRSRVSGLSSSIQQGRSRISGLSSSFQVGDKTSGAPVSMTDKSQRMVSSASVGTAVSERISTAEEEKVNGAVKDESKTRRKSKEEEVTGSLHGEQIALNQIHERSSLVHWATERTDSSNSPPDSPVTASRKALAYNYNNEGDSGDTNSTVYMLRQTIKQLKKALLRKDEENHDLHQMIAFLQHTQTAQEQEIERLSTIEQLSDKLSKSEQERMEKLVTQIEEDDEAAASNN